MTKVQTKERKIKLQKKRVTIVILDVKTHAVPKRKARDKLVEDGRVQELLIGINESETEVCRKVKDKMSKFLGDTSFKYMAVSSSSDIIPAEVPEGENEWSGQAVLQIANGGSIYIKPCQQSSEQPPLSVNPPLPHQSPPPAPVHPCQNPPPVPVHSHQNPPPAPVHFCQNPLPAPVHCKKLEVDLTQKRSSQLQSGFI